MQATTTQLDPRALYRLPWTLNDNVLAWLEPTKRCNLYCQGCYSRNDPKSDKTLEQVRADLDVFVANRNVDSISIAGGDPLVYPHIVEVVRIIREEYGKKPVLNTNGLALTPELVRDLKKAGLYGFTFHVDSSQVRPHWKNKTEVELNVLRGQLANMVAEVGGLSVAFNSTIFRHTLKDVPALVKWAQDNIEIVHSMVFILYRTLRTEEFDFYAQGKKVEVENELVYKDMDENPDPLVAQEIVDVIRGADPAYEPCAYLGGTRDPQSFKWLLSGRLASKDEVYGYVGPRYMEVVQNVHHAVAGSYLAYVEPGMLSMGRSIMAGFSAFDAGTRDAAKTYAKSALRGALRGRAVPPTAHFQSLVVIQPIDVMADGEANMCDGCPDITVHNGELVWSCRLDERQQYGCFLAAVPKPRDALIPEATLVSRSASSPREPLPAE